MKTSSRAPEKQSRNQSLFSLPVGGKSFLLLHGALLLYAGVSVLGKNAANALSVQHTPGILLWFGLEFLALLVYTVLWQKALGRMPLNFAYSNKGICTLWTCLFGVLLFGETLTAGKAVGILVVLAGVYLVVTDHG